MIALLFATDKECSAALGPLGAPRVRRGEAALWEALGRQWVVGVSGVGLVNAALFTGGALAELELAGMVSLGLAGSFDLETLPLGALTLVRWEVWPEYGLGPEDGASEGGSNKGLADPRGLGFHLARLPNGGERIWDRVDHTPDEALRRMGLAPDPAWPWSVGLSVSTVTADPARAKGLRQAYGQNRTPMVENMEGFAPAYACALSGLPFAELRAVSNLVGSRKPRHWDLDKALESLAQGARQLLSPDTKA